MRLLPHCALILALASTSQAFGEVLSHWSYGSKGDVYILNSPNSPQPLENVPIPFRQGDTLYVSATGCINAVGTGWVLYSNPPANMPSATIWIPGNPDTGGSQYNGTSLRKIQNKFLDIKAPPNASGLMLGYGPLGQTQSFDYNSASIKDPNCQGMPHAVVTIAVVHAENNLLADVLSVSNEKLNFRFDTWKNGRTDPNSVELNPIFIGQVEVCKFATWAGAFFGNKSTDLRSCLNTGYPYAESSCNAFQIRSANPDDTQQNIITSSQDFGNLLIIRLLKDMWAFNHDGENLSCPHLDYDPCILDQAKYNYTGKVCPRYATCDANNPSDENRDNCAACYFQPWQHQYYTVNKFPYKGHSYLLADQGLDDDIHKFQDLQKDPIFNNLPESRKFAEVSPIVSRWWPIIDTRWNFSDIRQTRTSAADHTEKNTCFSGALRTDTSPVCSLGHIFYHNFAGSVFGLGGHVDLETATYQGRLWFEDHSPATPEFGGYDDDDVSWGISPDFGEGSSGGEKSVHVERSAWSSIRLFRKANPGRKDFWTGLADALDQDNAAWVGFDSSASPGTRFMPDENIVAYLEQEMSERTDLVAEPLASRRKVLRIDEKDGVVTDYEPYAMPAASRAIVIGNLGLDCYHGCNPELHPAYLVAIRTRAGPYWERWAFFLHKTADEGLCSQQPHPAALPNGKVQFFIPHLGADRASVYANTQADVFGRASGTNIHTGEFESWKWNWAKANSEHVQVQLIPGQGALVTLDLVVDAQKDDPDPLTTDSIDGVDWVEGEIGITWVFPYWRYDKFQAEETKSRALWSIEANRPLPPRPPGAVDTMADIRAAIERSPLSAERKQAEAISSSFQSGLLNRGDSDGPGAARSVGVARYLAKVKKERPAVFERYEAELAGIDELLDRQSGIKHVPVACPISVRLPLSKQTLGDISVERHTSILKRGTREASTTSDSVTLHEDKTKVALAITCRMFRSDPTFPLTDECRQISVRSGGLKSVNQAGSQTQGKRRCESISMELGPCIKVTAGQTFNIQRLSAVQVRINPTIFCEQFVRDDAFEVATRNGPVIFVAGERQGEFFMQASEAVIQALFRDKNEAKVSRRKTGGLIAE